LILYDLTVLVFDEYKVGKQPDETFVGRISREFDFFGYRFSPPRLGVDRVSMNRFVEQFSRLYEQGATASRIG
jgi:hypothetical protein